MTGNGKMCDSFATTKYWAVNCGVEEVIVFFRRAQYFWRWEDDWRGDPVTESRSMLAWQCWLCKVGLAMSTCSSVRFGPLSGFPLSIEPTSSYCRAMESYEIFGVIIKYTSAQYTLARYFPIFEDAAYSATRPRVTCQDFPLYRSSSRDMNQTLL
jgi:hypothetical protein